MSVIASQMSGIAILFIRVAISISLIEVRMRRDAAQMPQTVEVKFGTPQSLFLARNAHDFLLAIRSRTVSSSKVASGVRCQVEASRPKAPLTSCHLGVGKRDLSPLVGRLKASADKSLFLRLVLR